MHKISRNKDTLLIEEALKEKLFYTFYIEYIEQAINKIVFQNNIRTSSNFIIGLTEVLFVKLQKIAIRTLILEINVERESNHLKGINEYEQYNFFVNNLLSSNDYKKNIFKNYPILPELIHSCTDNFVLYINEVIAHFSKDESLLIKNMKIQDSIRLINIEALSNDEHNCGKFVLKLTLNGNSQIIYKPHSIRTTKLYNEILAIIYRKLDIKIPEYNILDKGDYGWESFVHYQECQTDSMVNIFYRKLGINLALLYLLNVHDLHMENLIACSEDPVFVDLENFLAYEKSDQKNRGLDHICSSVLRMGVLPFYVKYRNGGLDVSAIGAGSDSETLLRKRTIINKFTSHIKIGYNEVSMTRKMNLPMLNGKCVESYNYVAEIKKGFIEGYNYLLRHKPELISKVNQEKKIIFRHLLGDTNQYSILLNSSYHPELLKYKDNRLNFLSNLSKKYSSLTEDNKKIVSAEIKNLVHGDIPYFTFDLQSKNLYWNNTVIIQDYFDKPAINRLYDKVNLLCDEDLKRQIMLIDLSMNLFFKSHQPYKSNFSLSVNENVIEKITLDSHKISSAIIYLGEHIQNSALRYSDNKIGWFGTRCLSLDEKNWNITFSDMYLYGGIAGIAIFYHALQHTLKSGKFKPICTSLDNTMFSYTDELYSEGYSSANFCTGALQGEGSIVYAYEVLFKITNNKCYLDYAKKHCKIVLEACHTDKIYDLMSGNGGFAIILVNLYKLTNDNYYLNKAYVILKKLLDYSINIDGGIGWCVEGQSKPLGGLSHGNSGMILSYLKYREAANTLDFDEIIKKLVKYENLLYIPEEGNWKDLRLKNKVEKSTVAWCHGAGGILLARLMKIIECKEDIKKAINKILEQKSCNSMCLCHGYSGYIETLNIYLNKVNCKKVNNIYIKNINWLVSNILEEKLSNIYYERENPGFMAGISGIGYTLLRSLDNSLPAILSIDL